MDNIQFKLEISNFINSYSNQIHDNYLFTDLNDYLTHMNNLNYSIEDVLFHNIIKITLISVNPNFILSK